jgi:hypothetical protein
MSGLWLVIIATIVVFITFYKGANPLQIVPGINGGEPVVIHAGDNEKITLYVYESVAVSSRKWNSFYDRRHVGAKSPLLELCDESHRKNHTIGDIIPVTDSDLIQLLEPEIRKVAAGVRGDVSLQHDRLLRDALLIKFICKNGGIIMPRNTFIIENTGHLWKQVIRMDGDGKPVGVIGYGGSGNDEYGAPVFACRGGGFSDELVDVLLREGAMREFRGGVTFAGGIPVVLGRATEIGFPTIELEGVTEVKTSRLTEIGEYRDGGIVVRIPFPQGSGKNSIVRRDEWIYVADVETLLENQTVITSIISRGCDLR